MSIQEEEATLSEKAGNLIDGKRRQRKSKVTDEEYSQVENFWKELHNEQSTDEPSRLPAR